MSLIDIPLDRIREDDLGRLIATEAAESVYIDYKEATYGSTGEQHREFLADNRLLPTRLVVTSSSG